MLQGSKDHEMPINQKDLIKDVFSSASIAIRRPPSVGLEFSQQIASTDLLTSMAH